MNDRLRRRNRVVLIGLAGVVAGMAGLSFAAVPLYSLFCQATGYFGTTQRADSAAGVARLDRVMTVRLDASVNRELPWAFAPDVRQVSVRLGEPMLVHYRARNQAARSVVGTAVFNVTPAQAGRYFQKVECFCFSEQVLRPGEEAELPVSFFVDPALADNPDLAHIDTITLSYTFYRSASQALSQAIDRITEAPDSGVGGTDQTTSQSRGKETNG